MRRSPIKRVNAKRRAARHAQAFGPQAALCHDLPCCVCDAYGLELCGRTEAHHEPPRGTAGGHDGDAIPLGMFHHRQRHDMGVHSFWTRYDRVDPEAVKAEMRRRVGEPAHSGEQR